MYRLRLLGGACIDAESGPLTGPVAQRRRLALLSLLAVAPTGSLSRERIATLLVPRGDGAQARHALSDALHAVRRALGKDAIIVVGNELRLNPDRVRSDVAEYEAALAAGDSEQAVALYRGPFLDGFFVSDAPEFERWVDDVCQRLARCHARLLEKEAEAAESCGEFSRAIHWWERLAQHDPYSSRALLRLCRVLEQYGDPAGALQCANMHAARLRDELEVDAGPDVHELIARLARPRDRGSRGLDATVRPRVPQLSLAVPATHITERAAVTQMRLLRSSAAAVVGLFGVGLAGVVGVTLRTPSPVVPRADSTAGDYYERGRHAWSKRTREGLDDAVRYFHTAIEQHPADARAHAGLASAYVMLGYLGFRPAEAMFPKGKAAALHALTLDSSLAAAHASLGQALMWERRWHEAERAFRQAIRQDPRDATAHQWYATMLVPLGRLDEAIVHTARASELDPLSRQINNMHGMILHYAGRSEAALAHYRRFVEAEPDTGWMRENPWVFSNMSRVYAARGQYREALGAVEHSLAVAPRHPRLRCDLATIYAAMGEPARALAVFSTADTTNGQYPFFRAQLFAALRQADSAFHWLDRVREWGPSPLGELRADPRLASIRSDPRYGLILARLGLIAPTPATQISPAESQHLELGRGML